MISVNGTISGSSQSFWIYCIYPRYDGIVVYSDGHLEDGGGTEWSQYSYLNVLDNWEIDSPLAVATAEANGGKEIREANNCHIFMTLYSSYEGYSDPIWLVEYENIGGQKVKNFVINARTGSLEATN